MFCCKLKQNYINKQEEIKKIKKIKQIKKIYNINCSNDKVLKEYEKMVNKELKEAETIFLKNKSKEEIYQYLLKRKIENNKYDSVNF